MANYVKFMRGSLAAYNALTEKDRDTLYFLSDSINSEGWLYLGERLISSPDDGVPTESFKLTDLIDVCISEDLNYDSLLMYNTSNKQWENWTFEQLQFVGATDTLGGFAGLVPAPKAGQEKMFLRADGTWADAGSRGQVFEAILKQNETHEIAIRNIVADYIVNNGDICIIKAPLHGEKYQYTSYVYEDSKWIAMDGNYDAENVYFKTDLVFTEAVGTISIPASGSATVPAAGKNIRQVMETIFSQEKNPSITQPSVNLTTNHASYEVGTSIVPTYSFSLNPGAYSYGPATEVSPTGYSIVITNKGETLETITVQSFPENGIVESDVENTDAFIIEDDTNYCVTATITHTDGRIPLTNLNNYYDAGQIISGNVARSSSSLSGYRAFFYGIDNGTTDIDSDLIRNRLINGGAYNGQKELTFIADDEKIKNVTRFIVAVPDSSTRSGLINAIITSSLNADATAEYKLLSSTVDVEGAEGYAPTAYKVWVYQPASIAINEVHKVILS